jgi:hypothetical protein
MAKPYSDTKVGEYLRSVVVDGIGAGHLLANHEADGDQSALTIPWNEPHLLL